MHAFRLTHFTGGTINPVWAPTALGSIIGALSTGPASGGGVGGGGAYLHNMRVLNQCAAAESNLLEPNQLKYFDRGNSKLWNLTLGNSFSSVSGLIYGPDRASGTVGVVYSVAVTKAAVEVQKARAIDTLIQLTPPFAERAIAKIILAGASVSKTIYDGVVYTGALVHCAEEAGNGLLPPVQ